METNQITCEHLLCLFFLQLEDRNAISSLNLYGFCEHCESESLFIKLLQAEWD